MICRGGHIAVFVLGVLPQVWAGDRPVLFENFDGKSGKASLEDSRWRLQASPTQSTYKVESEALLVTCFPGPLHGGFIEIPIPILRRGTLEFDANIDLGSSGNAWGVALTVDLYNIGLWWHDYAGDWRRYFPEPVSRRKQGFNIEPVGHRHLTKVAKSQWRHYKVSFDADSGEVAYYMDNMEDPVAIDFNMPVLGRAEFQGGYLRIGNLGVVNGPVRYGLDNIKLSPVSEEVASTLKKDRCLVFRGINFNAWGLDDPGTTLSAEQVRVYTVLQPGIALSPRNAFRLDRLPSTETIRRAKCIILADMPLDPGEAFPGPIQEKILEAVRQGSHLILLGGLFTLNKGDSANSPLLPALPVEGLEAQWALVHLEKGLPLELAKELWFEMPNPRPLISLYHPLRPTGDAEILASAGAAPLIVSRSEGEGRITIALAIPGAKEGESFFDQKIWTTLLTRLVSFPTPIQRNEPPHS